jgi:hypothetical protein
MHDVFEGVTQYDLAKILDHYIYTKRYFTLSQFNDRILAFPYEQHENAPPNERSVMRITIGQDSRPPLRIRN